MHSSLRFCAAVLLGLSVLSLAAMDVSHDPQSVLNTARQHLDNDEPRAALPLFEALTETYPDNAEYLTGLGRTQLALKRALRATWTLQEAIETDEKHEEAYRLLLKAYFASGQSERAYEILQEARKQFGERPWMEDV